MVTHAVVRPDRAVVARLGIDHARLGEADCRPGQPDARPGAQPDLSAGLDVQADHRGRGALDRQYTPHDDDSGARDAAAAAVDQPSCTTSRARAAAAQTTLIQALTISCNTAFGELGLTLGQTRAASQADAFGFDSTYSVPMKSAHERLPDRPQRRRHHPVGDRAVRRALDPAADGDGRRRDRQRRRGDEALPGRGTGRPRPAVIDQTKPTELRRLVTPRSRPNSPR